MAKGLVISILLLLLLGSQSQAQLAGSYSVDPSGNGDFVNLNEAVDSLHLYGVSGSVIFLIEPGIYTEQLHLLPINGASQVNQIIFVGNANDSLSVELRYSQTSFAGNYVVFFDGADYITFKKMTIQSTGNLYSKVVVFENQADYNTLENCRLVGNEVSVNYEDNAVIWSGNTKDQYNRVLYNAIVNGSSGVYFAGASGQIESGNSIENNIIFNFYANGIRAWYQAQCIIQSNDIESALLTHTSSYGVYAGYWGSSGIISNNRIEVRGSDYINVLRLDYSNATSAYPIDVYNNFVAQTGANTNNATGIMVYYSKNVNLYHNNVQVEGGSASNGRAIYFNSNVASNIHLMNNILANFGPGVAIHTTYSAISNGMISQSDYNVFFSAGSNLAKYSDYVMVTLADWQTAAPAWDAHSYSINPYYSGSGDLHVNNWNLDGLGLVLPQILLDIDGDIRDTLSPDIGADEFDLPPPMRGDYLIDINGNGDYTSIQGALNELNLLGVDSQVTVYLMPGVYQEKLVFTPIPGSTAQNRIRFTSSTGDSTSVIITNTQSTYAENYTIKISGADYLQFDHLYFKTDVISQYYRVLEITGNSVGINILNCVFEGVSNSVINSDYAVIYSNAGNDDSLHLINNHILKGSYGLYLKGSSEYNPEKYLVVSGNLIEDFSYRGMYIQYEKLYEIEGNTIRSAESPNTYSYVYGMYFNLNNEGGRVISNRIETRCQDSNYGIYLSNTDGTETTPVLIANNWVYCSTPSSSTCYGIYMYGGYYQELIHNSIQISSGSASSCAMYANSYSSDTTGHNKLINNSFSKINGGYAIYLSQMSLTTNSFASIDYNNYYAPVGVMGHLGNYDVLNLGDWQTMSLGDIHSLSTAPGFTIEGDCELLPSSSLIGSGFYYSLVPKDIDGEWRYTNAPCIGADEFITAQLLSDTQLIHFPVQWSLFSTYLIPENSDIDSVFANHLSSLIILKDKDGKVYWPPYVDMIQNLSIGEGYWAKMTNPEIVQIVGEPVDPTSLNFSLPANWTLIGYIKDYPSPLITELAGILPFVILIKNGSGSVYWPLYQVNLIGDLQPGSGYQVNLTQPATLTYPSN